MGGIAWETALTKEAVEVSGRPVIVLCHRLFNEAFLDAGATAVATKPVGSAELAELLAKATQKLVKEG